MDSRNDVSTNQNSDAAKDDSEKCVHEIIMKKTKESVKFMKTKKSGNGGGLYFWTWVYTLFIGLFGFDEKMFSFNFWVHQLPFLALAATNLVSVKSKKIGGILYIFLFIVFTIFFKTYRQIELLGLISLPLLVFGVIFIKREIKNRL